VLPLISVAPFLLFNRFSVFLRSVAAVCRTAIGAAGHVGAPGHRLRRL